MARFPFSLKQSVLAAAVPLFLVLMVFLWGYLPNGLDLAYTPAATVPLATSTTPAGPPAIIVTHLLTPATVKALYLTSWAAGSPALRDHVISLIKDTEANAIVVDVKDYTGRISFAVTDPALLLIGSVEERIPKVRELIAELHRQNIYVIGRISVFQDPFLVKKRPDLAVKRGSDGGVWKDYKGIGWLDPGAKEVWDYTVAVAQEAYRAGFDELNFDYIRFPSDGNVVDIAYNFYNPKDKTKPEQLSEFFAYLHDQLNDLPAPLSADIFGMTTTNTNDLNIGQTLENALAYFDYVSPMVYPSHYPPTWNGFKNPAEKPYEVIKIAMAEAVKREQAARLAAGAATTTPSKLRPWLQDFDLGAVYTAELVRAEKKAVYDVGLNSWMMWDPSNQYTREALDAI